MGWFLRFFLTSCPDCFWQGVAVNSRFRNVGLCFQNMNSGPGRLGAPEALGCQLHLLAGKRCWSEEWPEGLWIVWMMNASVMGDCLFLNRHKNIICSEEMNSHTNVMNLFLGDLVCLWDGLQVEELSSKAFEAGALNLCSRAYLVRRICLSASVGKSYHVSRGLFFFFFSFQLWHANSQLQHMESSSLTRDGTWAPVLGARSLSHWTTREAPSSRAWKKILAYPALHDALIVGFSPTPTIFLSNNLRVLLAAGRSGLCTKKGTCLYSRSLGKTFEAGPQIQSCVWWVLLANNLSLPLLHRLHKTLAKPIHLLAPTECILN